MDSQAVLSLVLLFPFESEFPGTLKNKKGGGGRGSFQGRDRKRKTKVESKKKSTIAASDGEHYHRELLCFVNGIQSIGNA